MNPDTFCGVRTEELRAKMLKWSLRNLRQVLGSGFDLLIIEFFSFLGSFRRSAEFCFSSKYVLAGIRSRISLVEGSSLFFSEPEQSSLEGQ